MVLTFKPVDKIIVRVTIHMKAFEQFFHVVLFIMHRLTPRDFLRQFLSSFVVICQVVVGKKIEVLTF